MLKTKELVKKQQMLLGDIMLTFIASTETL